MGNVVNDNRIVYVEPNDIYGQVDKHVLTPDYTDYCIYCNLIVEKTSRLKNPYAGDDASGKFAIGANMIDGEKGVHYTSFFSGESDSYNFLTTDYTDIHFNSVKEHTFVEGLQITSIDISYANRMCPMITMNMVDIRGAGLFGREESTHVNDGISGLERDEENNIIDNIYSGFMTFPYPKYKLHIKGYYGRAVTYQLTCSQFNGRFDSSTGNFNITATFIGYEYGCLQDLPLSYVMAAPFTKTGKKYWEKKKYSPEWNLYMKDGKGVEAPILMHDFFRNIKAGIEKNDEGKSLMEKVADESIIGMSKELEEKQGAITPIEEQLSEFIHALRKANSEPNTLIYEIDDEEPYGDKVIVVFSKNSNVNITKEVANAYNNLGDLINSYVNHYSFDGISLNMLPNNVTGTWDDEDKWARASISMPLFIKKGVRKIIAVSTTNFEKQIPMNGGEYELNDARLRIKKLNCIGDYSLNSRQSVYLHSKLKNSMPDASYPYASIIVCEKWNTIPNIAESLKKKIDEYKSKMSDGSLVPISSVTGGVSPYIGNYFKMVICHVDTFLHTIWSCAEDIYKEINEGNREPGRLGIFNSHITDVSSDLYNPGVNKGVIPPFPAIYKNYNLENSSDSSVTRDSVKMVGWVGDVKGIVPWREQALVDEYYTAMKQVNDSTSDVPWTESDPSVLSFSLLPCFINDKQDKSRFYTLDGMAYYVATMSALILGAMNNKTVHQEECELIGAILAKNIFDGIEDKERLLNIKVSDNNIIDIATLTEVNGNDEAKLFEFATGNTSDRKHRIFSKEGDKLKYVYMLNNNHKPIIPLNTFSEWSELVKQYNIINSEDGSVITPASVIDGPYVTTERGNDFITSIPNITKQTFMNSHMFSIWLDACNVESMQINYDNYKSGGDNIGNYKKEKFIKFILNKYWKMEDNFVKYQTIKPEILTKLGDSIPDLSNNPDGEVTVMQLQTINNLSY